MMKTMLYLRGNGLVYMGVDCLGITCIYKVIPFIQKREADFDAIGWMGPGLESDLGCWIGEGDCLSYCDTTEGEYGK